MKPQPQQSELPLFDRPLADTKAKIWPFSDFIVYVDESGDHSLVNIDEGYPVFVLAFCIFHKRHYAETIIPRLEHFKFRHFGHDALVLHEHEIRKQKGDFSVLANLQLRHQFISELSEIMDQSNFVLAACVIDKKKLKQTNPQVSDPYHFALAYCLDGLRDFLTEKKQIDRKTYVLVERRGKKEDKALELEFRRICDNKMYPFDVIFEDKKSNLAGLQLADLVARPIGLNYLRPQQENRAFDILKKKLLCRGGRTNAGDDFEGYGLKIVPS